MSHRAFFIVSILSAGTSLLQGQAIIEFGTLTGRAAAAGPGANVGKSIVDAFGKVNQSLSGAAKVDTVAQPATLPAVKATPIPVAKPEPVLPPELSALVTGMDRADMLKKVGRPSMTISGGDVETCWYRSGSDSVTVTLRDGKVVTISAAESLSAK